ncbi:MAG: hypothetical protein BGO69_18490 [Bacteroidetes bacterium 46-16]|nr:MAG: hypothetical protein BGO69_18490 [Bacteroidetes bacterium 46-16]
MEAQNKLYDFIIIGCGPTGSTAATYLSKMGYSVLVFEKSKFPRAHEGESLLPFCYSMFQDLGVWEEMKTKFVRKPGARFSSHDGSNSSTWCFKSVIFDESYLSFNVFRPQFDLMLMNNARKNGVTVLEETKVEAVKLDRPDRIVEVDTVDKMGMKAHWEGKFLIDATGQDTFLAKRIGSKNAYKELDRIAFLAHWKGGNFKHGLDVGLINIVYLEKGKRGWFALQPVGKDLMSIALIVERKYLKEQKKIFTEQGVADWQKEFYMKEIWECEVTKEVLMGGMMDHDLMVISDYSYFSDKWYGDNFALLGDAYKFLDPIFSTGVYLGMKSAQMFAEAMHVKLTSDQETGDKKLAETFETISGGYNLVEQFIDIFYDPNSFNLAEVSSKSESVYHGYEAAFAMVHLLLAGDFFTNYKKYHDFLAMLKDPVQYGRWKNFIVSVPHFDEATCGTNPGEVFGAIVEEFKMDMPIS